MEHFSYGVFRQSIGGVGKMDKQKLIDHIKELWKDELSQDASFLGPYDLGVFSTISNVIEVIEDFEDGGENK